MAVVGATSKEMRLLRGDVMAGIAAARNMGVLQPGEIAALEAQLGDPTSVRGALEGLIMGKGALTRPFETFIERRDHIALVIDEYGGTDGLVSMEDLVETLLGVEIVDEADQEEDMQRLARRQWEQRAKALGLPIAASNPEPGVSNP